MVNHLTTENLIPAGIKDDSTIAQSKCIDTLANIDISPVLIYLIDNVHPSALPHLAQQFHIEGYEGWAYAETEQDKRRLLKSALVNHKKKGTSKSIVTALATLGFQTEIIQSENYNGIPYHYKIKITATEKDLSLQNQQDIVAMSDEYKNYKSVLDGLIIELPHEGTFYWGGGSVIGVRVIIGEE